MGNNLLPDIRSQTLHQAFCCFRLIILQIGKHIQRLVFNPSHPFRLAQPLGYNSHIIYSHINQHHETQENSLHTEQCWHKRSGEQVYQQYRYHTCRDDGASLIQGLAQRCNSQDKDDKQVADNTQVIISQTEIDTKYAIKSQFGEHQKIKRRNTFHESNLPLPDKELQDAEHECMQTAKA